MIGRQTAARLAVALYDRATTPTKKAVTRWRVAPADGISRKQSCEATTAGCVGEDLHTQSTKSPGLTSAPGPLSARGTSAACRRLMNVTRLVVELDDDAARRLAERAEREGIEPSTLARRLLSEASEVDPFEFIGSFASHAANGRDADEFLDREGFGAP